MTESAGATFAEVYNSLRSFAKDEGAARSDEDFVKFLQGKGAALAKVLGLDLDQTPGRLWNTLAETLGERIDQLQPRDGTRRSLSLADKIEQYRNLVRVYFNLLQDETLTGDLTARKQYLARHSVEKYRVQVSAGQKDFADACQKIAAHLCPGDVTEPTLAKLPPKDADKVSTFIHREPLEQKFWQAAKELPQGVVCFVGSRGTGKSRLASELVAQMEASGRDSFRLDASSSSALYQSIARELSLRDIPTVGREDAQLARDFTSYIANPKNGQPVVLLDDVADGEIVEAIISHKPTTLFVLTSNYGELALRCPYRLVEVDEMLPAEAAGLARMLIEPERATDDECSLLAVELHNLPLAIDHASGLINDGWMQVPVFVAQQQLQAGVAYDSRPGSSTERSLTFIYLEMLNRLTDECPEALLLLWLLAQTLSYAIPLSLLSDSHDILLTRLGVAPTTPGYPFAVGFAELRRLRLLKSDDEQWRMHSLTHQLVGVLLAGDMKQDAIISILAAFGFSVPDALIGRALQGAINGEYAHVDCALNRLSSISDDERYDCNLGRVVTILGKFDGIHNQAFDQRGRLLHVWQILYTGGALPEASKKALGQLKDLDLDHAELAYASAASDYASDGDHLRYATNLHAIAGVANQNVNDDDLEHRVWARLLENDALLIVKIKPAAELFTFAFATMQLLWSWPEPPSLWLGEAFLRAAEARAKEGDWKNATELYLWARDAFGKGEQQASNICGKAFALSGARHATTITGSEGRWNIQSEMGALSNEEIAKFQDYGQFSKTGLPLLSMEANAALARVTAQAAVTDLIKLFAVNSRHDEFQKAYAENHQFYYFWIPVLDSREPRSFSEHYDQIRYDAARNNDYPACATRCNALRKLAREDNDIELALRADLLHLKLNALRAPGELTLAQARTFISSAGTVAAIARESTFRYLHHEAVAAAHFIVSCVDRSDQDYGTLQSLLEVESIPSILDDAFEEREVSILPWCKRVLEGQVSPFGILAF